MTDAIAFVPPVALLALLLWNLRVLERDPKFTGDHGKIAQLHHGYYGFVLAVLAVIAQFYVFHFEMWGALAMLLLYLLGCWWLWDDARMHYQQRKEPFKKSPWHRFAAKVGAI